MRWPFSSPYPESRPEDVDCLEFDYVVIGGGVAGCVLASRLSEDPSVSVLLLERGASKNTFLSRIPTASCDIINGDFGAVNWDCESMEHCGNRKQSVYRAEILGGGSRINSMVYTRGGAADYDSWSEMGHLEWSYQKLQKYFMRAETTLNQPKLDYRGSAGPWTNQSFTFLRWPFDGYRIFRHAAIAMGYPLIPDLNSPHAPPDGLGTTDLTIDEKMERVSTFTAFLPHTIAVARKQHLTICTEAIVSRLGFSGSKKQLRAESVHFQSRDMKHGDRVFSVKIRKEAIISSGALGSPHVLMLSGIGPRKHLEEYGVDVILDLPGVGTGLKDHVGLPLAWEVPLAESINKLSASIWRAIYELLKFVLFRIGLLCTPFLSVLLFVRSTTLDDETLTFSAPSNEVKSVTKGGKIPSVELIPDIEIMPMATGATDDQAEFVKFSKIGMFSLLPVLLLPKSSGSVRLRSSDARDFPRVDFGFMSDPADYVIARKALRLGLKFGDAMKAQGFPLLRLLVGPASEKEEDLDVHIRQRARTAFHYGCSCRMGDKDDKVAPGVVDDELRVHGVANLRVCDTSIFPQMVAAHTQAPAVMVAEKCADMIKNSKSYV